MEANGQSSPQLPVARPEQSESSSGAKPYNTVFESIFARTEGENGLPSVVACVAYYFYKCEKREWLVEKKKHGPVSEEALDTYVSASLGLKRLATSVRVYPTDPQGRSLKQQAADARMCAYFAKAPPQSEHEIKVAREVGFLPPALPCPDDRSPA